MGRISSLIPKKRLLSNPINYFYYYTHNLLEIEMEESSSHLRGCSDFNVDYRVDVGGSEYPLISVSIVPSIELHLSVYTAIESD